jgi:hypothetical protein
MTMTMQEARAASLVEQLCATFTPIVHSFVGDRVIIKVRWDHYSKQVDMHMYDLAVKIIGEMPAHRLTDFACAIDALCVYSGPKLEVGSYRYQIGDGDDGNAVTYLDGEFHIWLRTWHEEA